MSDRLEMLLKLSHELGRPERRLAILGEGNVSCRMDKQTFLVKSSGSSLEALAPDGVVRTRLVPLLELLDREEPGDEEVTRLLWEARAPDGPPGGPGVGHRKPSTEAVLHAYLLTLAGVGFVAHTHPESVNGVMCSPRAREFAARRMFPDEIVCCGPESVFVDYADPGVPLAKRIRAEVGAYIERAGRVPRALLLKNHGLVAIGATAAAALATTLMCDKAARIFTAATTMGGPVFLPQAEVERIDCREDEVYRQKELGMHD